MAAQRSKAILGCSSSPGRAPQGLLVRASLAWPLGKSEAVAKR
eukprot:CAMPEP_0172734232 /NCGR_PEP_ID=MMETSP1074-20121228/109375_1 /TAXON_ID=2916 /ORGANISM="Ceratium fusus, Strain PA161109" /LENGTH=42 /DNA_ID= /DNA_START= /DNA_END= /DNA_ORIENTATION=